MDRALAVSAPGGRVARDGLTVEVYIHRFAGADEDWTRGASTTGVASLAWTGLFREAGECYEAFERVASEDGIASFSDSQIVRHGPCLPSRSGGLNGEAISGVSECARGHRSAGYPTA